MSFTRAKALQSLQNGLRQSSARPAVRSNSFRRAQLQAKRFASSGHGNEQKSDLPWLIGALVITPPSVYYLWPAAHTDDHHDDHHDDHAKHEEHEEPEGEEKSGEDNAEAEDVKEESEDTKEEKPAETSEDKNDVPAEGEGEAKPAKSNGNVEGVNFKGHMKEDSDGASHTEKLESDSKGGVKKRLDSGLAKNLGPGHDQEGSDRDMTTMDGKQKGLSNTQTRHSEPIHESSEKSKKPDGTPETAKTIGTVDPEKTSGPQGSKK